MTPEARLHAQLRQARLRLLASDAALLDMRRSLSWRLTRPLRVVERRWPGLARGLQRVLRLLAWTLRGRLLVGLRRLRAEREVAALPADTLPPGPPPTVVDTAGRPGIVIVDESVPRPDRAAGGRATLGVIEALLDAGWAVTFWPFDRGYADGYTAALEALGVPVIDARHDCAFADWLARYPHRSTHVMLMRPRPAMAVLADALRHGARISYYGHDIHGLRLRREAELRGDAFLADTAARELALERQVWRVADVVLYLSDEEAAFVRAQEPGVDARRVPGFVFAEFPDPPSPPANASLLFVGGFGHAPNTDAAIWFATAVLPLVVRDCPSARLILAGADPGPAVAALAGASVEIAGWLSDAELYARYGAVRVVVAPLRFGAGVKGKVVEALHLGRPLVATSVAAEGLPGLADIVPVADEPERIAAAIRRLLDDDVAWAAQAAAQIDYAKTHCSRAALQAALLAALAD